MPNRSDRQTDSGRDSAREIADAVAAASLPALMMSMIHMTGDTSLLDGPIRPTAPTAPDPIAGLTPEEQAEIRARAVDAYLLFAKEGKTPAVPTRSNPFDECAF